MQGVNEAFSATADCPWGFIHTGIDFFPTGDDKAFRAVCDGTVESVELWQNGVHWQVNVRIQCDFNPWSRIEYSFEPMSADEGDGLTQLSRITVSPGDHAARGDVIGRLLESGDGTHVDFGLSVGWERVSPEFYFGREAKASILRLIRAVWGDDAKMTY